LRLLRDADRDVAAGSGVGVDVVIGGGWWGVVERRDRVVGALRCVAFRRDVWGEGRWHWRFETSQWRCLHSKSNAQGEIRP